MSVMEDPADQLCMALACKRFAQVSSLKPIKIISSVKFRYIPAGPPCHEVFMMLRRIAPMDENGRQKAMWSLCTECLRYQPTKKSCWGKDGLEYAKLEPAKDAWKTWLNAVRDWTDKFAFQCPVCWLRAKRELMEVECAKAAVAAVAEDLAAADQLQAEAEAAAKKLEEADKEEEATDDDEVMTYDEEGMADDEEEMTEEEEEEEEEEEDDLYDA